ncbi:predicted protein, partial [Nematostella vectensis]
MHVLHVLHRNILSQVQDDLRHLKETISNAGGSTEIIDLKALESAITRTEISVREKAEQFIQASNNQVVTLPSLEAPGIKRTDAFRNKNSAFSMKSVLLNKQKKTGSRLLQPLVVAREGNKPGPNAPAPGQQAKNLRNLQVISNPAHPVARDLLHDKYGVAFPNLVNRRDDQEKAPGKVVTGTSVDHLSTLPKANRVDATRTPPPISEDDAKKGILSLIERGLIPPAAELTLEPSPVRHHQAPVSDSKLTNPILSHLLPFNPIPFILHPILSHTFPSRMGSCRECAFSLHAVCFKGLDTGISQEAPPGQSNRSLRSCEYIVTQTLPSTEVPAPVPTPASELKSVHKFVIQNGKTRVTSQDYLNFKQHYCLSWGSILTLIVKLEELFSNFSVPIAFIDGDRLADLALVFELEQEPSLEHFMTCILNGDDVEKIIRTPGRRYLGPNGTEMAAIKIQSTWRRHKDRTAYLIYRKQKWAAGVIAISWIMNCKLSMIRKQLKQTRLNQLDRFRIRTKRLKQEWPRIQQSRRVIIHLPSMGYPQHIRDDLSNISLLQNLQMARLCDIADPKVEVIYICPVEVNEEVYQYYAKLLAMKARPLSSTKKPGEEDDNIENRYKIIVPDAVNSFPTHNMSLSSILMYSPRTIKRIRNLIKGRDAYIVSGVVNKDDVYVADLLDIPILSAEPEVSQLYSTKSGSKRIFRSGQVSIPPGQFDIYSLPQLHESLSQLVTENLHVERWIFKMDSEFNGRGTAYCDVTPHLKCYSWALKECQRYGEKWAKKWAHEPTLIKVSAEIPDILSRHAHPVNSELYPTWEGFLHDFLKRGGVVEACPPSESVTALTVDVLIEPTGDSKILSMGDQIHATSPLMCWGYSVPQASVEPAVLSAAIEKTTLACKLRGIMGYFSIDFVTFIDPHTMEQQVWAVDLKLQYSDSMAMTNLMLYVTGGAIDPTRASFEVPVKRKREESGRRRRRRVTDDKEPPPNPNRYAITSTRLLHSNLSVIHYSVFFQMCRAHGIGYDIKEKAGTIFTLVDSSKRDHLGMLVMSDDLQGSLSTFARNLSVIHQEISAPNMQGESNFQSAIDDIDNILGTTSENVE